MFRLLDKVSEKIDKIDKNQLIELFKKISGEYEVLGDILNSLPYGILVLAPNNSVEFINKTADWLFPLVHSKSYQEIPIWERIQDKDLRQCVKEGLLKETPVDDIEATINTVLGEKIISLSLSPLAKQGTLLGRILVVEDVTEKNHQLNQLLQAERLISLTNMTATVAHEIKNPLAGIGLQSQLVGHMLVSDPSEANKSHVFVEEEGKDKIQEHLDIINSEVERLNQIISNYLLSVRPFTGEKIMMPINVLLADLVYFYEDQFKDEKIQLRYLAGEQLPRVFIDEGNLRQALVNLINNAMHAMEETPSKELVIQSLFDAKEQKVVVVIRDNGCGMTPEQKEKIFQPYFTTKNTGTGLGLFVVEKIIAEHGGKIVCKSDLGVGTEFQIYFPVITDQRVLLQEDIH